MTVTNEGHRINNQTIDSRVSVKTLDKGFFHQIGIDKCKLKNLKPEVIRQEIDLNSGYII